MTQIEFTGSAPQAWPVLVGTSAHDDYHVIVGPDFMVEDGTAELLRSAIFTGSQITGSEEAFLRTIRGVRMHGQSESLHAIFLSKLLPRPVKAKEAGDRAQTRETRGVKILAGLVFLEDPHIALDSGEFRVSSEFLTRVAIDPWMELYWEHYTRHPGDGPIAAPSVTVRGAAADEHLLRVRRIADFDASALRVRVRRASAPAGRLAQREPEPEPVPTPEANTVPLPIPPNDSPVPEQPDRSDSLIWLGAGVAGGVALLWLLYRFLR